MTRVKVILLICIHMHVSMLEKREGLTMFLKSDLKIHIFNTGSMIYRITAILKGETDIIANISAILIGPVGIFVIMSVIVFIGDVIMCFTLD